MTVWWRIAERNGRFYIESRTPYIDWDVAVVTLGFTERGDAEQQVQARILSGNGEWWTAPNTLTAEEADALTARFAGRDSELADDMHNEQEYIDPKHLEFAQYLIEHGRISEEIAE